MEQITVYANTNHSIEIRFMNDDQTQPSMLEGIRTEQQIAQIMSNRKYKGLTPFGTKLRQKVIDGIVLPKLRQPRVGCLRVPPEDARRPGRGNRVRRERQILQHQRGGEPGLVVAVSRGGRHRAGHRAVGG